jgi:hypothetical protein
MSRVGTGSIHLASFDVRFHLHGLSPFFVRVVLPMAA